MMIPGPGTDAHLALAGLRPLLDRSHKVAELPQFPGSSRDIALELPLDLTNAQIEKVISKSNDLGVRIIRMR